MLLPAQSPDRVSNFVARDRKGQPVKTLTADQIELIDDGVKQQPTLRLFDGADMVEGSQRKPAEPLRRVRLITIVFEGMNNEQRRLAKQIANDLIKEDKDPTHLFAVFKFSNQMSLLEPFTANREATRKAIDLATSGVANTRYAEVNKEVKARLAQLAATQKSLTDEDVAPANLDKSPALAGALARLQLAMLTEDTIDDAEGTRRTIAFIDALTAGLRTIPGRKPIAYLNAGVTLPTNLDVPFEAMLGRANTSGVALYPLDCRGITTESQASGVNESISGAAAVIADGIENRERGDNPRRLESVVEGLRGNVQAQLITMANATGGLMSVESNDPKRQLRELIADTTTYYEATYNPDIKEYTGVYRKTIINAKSADARLRTRDGYLAMPPGQENLLPYELPLFKAFALNPMPRDVEFRSGAWRLKSTKDRVDGIVAVEVPFAGMAFATDEAKALYAARLSLVTQIRDAQGNTIAKFTRDLPLKGKLEQLEALKSSNFNFRERFSVAPGRYIIETAVIDQLSRKVGARKTSFMAAPPAATLGISSVTVVRNFQPGAKDLTPEDPFQYQGGRITPTLNTTLKAVKGAQMALFFTVYPESGSAPQAIVQYFKDGELAGSANLPLPTADAQGRIPYVLSSPLDAMPPGNYEVKVIIKQGAAAVAESVFLTVGA